MELRQGKLKKPYCGLIYGMPGSGKTSLVAARKKNFFIGTEPNSEFSIVGFPPADSYEQFLQQLSQCVTPAKKAGCDTIVIDHLTEVERLCKISFVGESENVGTWKKGFGVGYHELERLLNQQVVSVIKEIQKAGLNVILLGHANEKHYTNLITGVESKIFKPQLEEKSLNLFSAFCDFIFHIHRVHSGAKSGKGLQKPQRYLFTAYTEANYAKKRGIEIPDEIKLDDVKDIETNPIWGKIHAEISKTFGPSVVAKKPKPVKKAEPKKAEPIPGVSQDKKEKYQALKTEVSKYVKGDDIPDVNELSDERIDNGISYMEGVLLKLKTK